MITEQDDTQRIRELNDAFRRGLGSGQRLMTQGIAALPLRDQIAITTKVMQFEAFTPDNDPHGEHDFGSEDPADPAQTTLSCRLPNIRPLLSSIYR